MHMHSHGSCNLCSSIGQASPASGTAGHEGLCGSSRCDHCSSHLMDANSRCNCCASAWAPLLSPFLASDTSFSMSRCAACEDDDTAAAPLHWGYLEVRGDGLMQYLTLS